jgi:hypothetical protein
VSKPLLLAYPSLGAFAGMFAADFELVHLPEEASARAAFLAGPGQTIEAAVGIGSIGVPAEVYDLPKLKLIACSEHFHEVLIREANVHITSQWTNRK